MRLRYNYRLNTEKNIKKYNNKDLHIDRHNTIIILDWDDTLCPTTWMMEKNIDLLNPKSRGDNILFFKRLDNKLSELLKIMISLGIVIIITNAMPEWIELSSSVLPKTSEILKRIEVVSAREKYQGKAELSDWKRHTFKEELHKKLLEKSYTNIISMGDAEYEYMALIDLYKWERMPHKYLKSIKFLKSPSDNKLMDQIDIMIENIEGICKSRRHHDLVMN